MMTAFADKKSLIPACVRFPDDRHSNPFANLFLFRQ